MEKLLFILNPKAGVDRNKTIASAIKEHLDSSLYDWELAFTQYAGHGTLLAKEAIEKGVKTIVAVGGDGSVNDVIQSLVGKDVALGVIPMGSGNGLARSVGLPLKVKNAIKVLNKRNIHAIDLGLVNGEKYFISNAGVGFDAVVTKEFAKSDKRGFLSYIDIIVKKMFSFKSKDWEIEIDGKVYHHKAFMLTIANGPQLGYNFQIAPVAIFNDGVFDIVVINKHPRLLTGIIGLQGFTDTLLKNRYVSHYTGKKIVIRNQENDTMQLDGDFEECVMPLEIEIQEKALKLLCP
ncbi:MAG TPA: diacylglycerol kinase family lipid kinase [Edaphocola sp.]|nr:diacylglycerol kinase family lipid kinase [Edaphocola sp.]